MVDRNLTGNARSCLRRIKVHPQASHLLGIPQVLQKHPPTAPQIQNTLCGFYPMINHLEIRFFLNLIAIFDLAKAVDVLLALLFFIKSIEKNTHGAEEGIGLNQKGIMSMRVIDFEIGGLLP